jgi:sporulation protein YlmC with PRC-barrel domain
MMEVVMNTLHSIENIFDFAIAAKDGDIGRIKDVYFDDHEWTIRHLVVDTGGWLTGRKVLVPPNAVMKIGRG